MLIQKMLKSNRGSSLVLTLIVLIILTMLGSAIMMVTLSEAKMSVSYRNYNGAYYAAEAGVEQIAMELDKKIGQLQKDAKNAADASGTNVEANWLRDYKAAFLSGLESEFGSGRYDETDINKVLLGNDVQTGTMASLINTGNDSRSCAYKDLDQANPGKSRVVLNSLTFDDSDAARDNYSLVLNVIGVENAYKKNLTVKLKVLIDPPYDIHTTSGTGGNNGGGSSTPADNEIPDAQMPSVLKKAVVSEKNMLTVGGTTTINGDTLVFGTVPNDTHGSEELDAPWYRYGGILAGLPDITTLGSSDGTDLDRNGDGLPDSQSNSSSAGFLGFNTTGLSGSGKYAFHGNVATMSYLHTLFGTSSSHSDIQVTGNTYARSIRAESQSQASQLNFNGNAYVINSLQVDSNDSNAVMNGNYYGFVSSANDISGGSNITPEVKYINQYSSSVIINGDSNVTFKNNGPSGNQIYLGGYTFFKNIRDGNNNPYLTGISALKSSRRVENAFYAREDGTDQTSNPNYLYYGTGAGEFDTNPVWKLFGSLYMMYQYHDAHMAVKNFLPNNKAIHFKTYWNNILDWNTVPFDTGKEHKINDVDVTDDIDIYNTYLNMDNISIEDSSGHLKTGSLSGYSNGAVVANGRIFDQASQDINLPPSTSFADVQAACSSDYYSRVGDLLADSFNAASPKLNYIAPTKFLTGGHIDVTRDISGKSNVYYGSGDTFVTNAGGQWKCNGKAISASPGVIYANGDLYIDPGFQFSGVIFATGNIRIESGFKLAGTLLAGGNILVKGDAEMTYDKAAISQLLMGDKDIDAFFKMSATPPTGGTGTGGGGGSGSGSKMDITKIKMDNMVIMDWKQTNLQ